MNENYSLDLIKGDFPLSDANDLLLEMFRFKISYHEGKLRHDYSRFGKDINHSKRRIQQLKATVQQLRALMAQAKEVGEEISIDCTLNIQVNSHSIPWRKQF